MMPWQAAILGVVEGLTEFLPVSSTGHLMAAASLMGLPSSDKLTSFTIAIQLGAIAAVAVPYAKRLFTDAAVLRRVVVAFLPTAFIGAIVYPLVKRTLLGNVGIVPWALFLGGVALIVIEKIVRGKPAKVSDLAKLDYRRCLLIGVAQTLAFIPGVSRSGATIMGGLIAGVRREAIVEFSFLLALPTMVAATGLDLYKNAALFSQADTINLGIGFITSFVVALAAVRWFLAYVKTKTLEPFGVYRMIAAVILWKAL